MSDTTKEPAPGAEKKETAKSVAAEISRLQKKLVYARHNLQVVRDGKTVDIAAGSPLLRSDLSPKEFDFFKGAGSLSDTPVAAATTAAPAE